MNEAQHNPGELSNEISSLHRFNVSSLSLSSSILRSPLTHSNSQHLPIQLLTSIKFKFIQKYCPDRNRLTSDGLSVSRLAEQTTAAQSPENEPPWPVAAQPISSPSRAQQSKQTERVRLQPDSIRREAEAQPKAQLAKTRLRLVRALKHQLQRHDAVQFLLFCLCVCMCVCACLITPPHAPALISNAAAARVIPSYARSEFIYAHQQRGHRTNCVAAKLNI